MNFEELRTPLKSPKKYKKRKGRGVDMKVEEFMSFGNSNYFSTYTDEEYCSNKRTKDGRNGDPEVERRIEDWLALRNICSSGSNEKKNIFFEERRQRVDSISHFSNQGENDSTDGSPINGRVIPCSDNLSPQSSKLAQKRSNFSSCVNMREQTSTQDLRKDQKVIRIVCSEQKPKPRDQVVDSPPDSYEYVDQDYNLILSGF